MAIGNRGFTLKTEKEFAIMRKGGKKLAKVKNALKERVKVGASAYELDQLAEQMIVNLGGKPSFKMVPKYHWATCININDGVVHGIPTKETIFNKGDVVSVDLGMYYGGFHTDTSFSVGLDVDEETKEFLEAGSEALNKAVAKAVNGNRIYDISKTIEKTLKKHNLNPVKVLVGHGIGRQLHEDPQIPCFVGTKREKTPEILEGAAMAIEVMYTPGSGDVQLEDDGWTISSSDGTITGLFEDTVFVTKNGPLVITR